MIRKPVAALQNKALKGLRQVEEIFNAVPVMLHFTQRGDPLCGNSIKSIQQSTCRQQRKRHGEAFFNSSMLSNAKNSKYVKALTSKRVAP
ncbi:hypothetical protein OH492_07885 [Vibrio chagasii]|nr:hypothetical protein [Vibrio chagasii]